jgi:predicted acylesterase/phospholipase RssA
MDFDKQKPILEANVVVEKEDDPPVADFDTIVLSGGAAKGMCALGGLQCAEDNFLLRNVTTYIGTSVGAIICYLLAIGYKPSEIMVYICTNQLLERMKHFDVAGAMRGAGALSFHPITEQLEKMTIAKIGHLPNLGTLNEKYDKTLVCVTYNRSSKHPVYLSHETHPDLPCLTALRMSAGLPYIFEKFKYGNSFFTDGGICDNFALHKGEELGKKILGIVLDEKGDDFGDIATMKFLEELYGYLTTPISQATEYKIANASDKCTIVRIKYAVKVFDFNLPSREKLEMFSHGYTVMATALL